MGDFGGLVETIKKAALDAVDAECPVFILYGTVVVVNPLSVNVEQKMTLEENQLVLTRNVTDYTTELTIDHWTEDEIHHVHIINNETQHTHAIQDTASGGGTSSPTIHTHTMQPTTHKHGYKGTKTFRVHNSLKVGDRVILLREQGGQRFIIIDKVG